MLKVNNWQVTYNNKDITNEPMLDYLEPNEAGTYEDKTLEADYEDYQANAKQDPFIL